MKKILFIVMAIAASCTFTSCSDDEWGNGDPAMEHIYYVGFEDWGKLKNDVVFNLKEGESVAIPIQFHSERVRSYDVVTYYYVSSSGLTYGTDYQVTDEAGHLLQPDDKGAFLLSWPKAVKGIQKVYVKGLKSKYVYDESKVNKEGLTAKQIEEAIKKEKDRILSLNLLTVQTFKPSEVISYTNITNSQTNDYEVRAFTQNYKVTVNVKK